MYFINSKKYLLIIIPLILLFCAVLRIHSQTGLEKIKKTGKLRVITDNNANCYYLYRGQPMGLEYELALGFAIHLDVDLEIITPDWQKMTPMIVKKQADIIAANLTLTQKREKTLDFSTGLFPIQQYIICHINNDSVNSINALEGKSIHIRKNTSYHETLKTLQNSGCNFNLILYDDLPSEEFIRRVAEGKIELTVADSHIAQLNRKYYPTAKLAFSIDDEQWLGWAVKNNNKELLSAINQYFAKIKANGQFDRLYHKYYGHSEIFDYVDISTFHSRIESRLKNFEDLIRDESEKYGFDWRLIAAMIYQESHFNPRAKSYTGVRGLMQLTLMTAREMGISNRLNPEQSIKGGTKYLYKIYQRFDDIPEHDRLYFTLAAYNIGYGHIRDAQKLAIEQGLSPIQWQSMKKTLPLLRIRKYYQKTRYGYARGTEPVRYVERIRSYYDILRRKAIS